MNEAMSYPERYGRLAEAVRAFLAGESKRADLERAYRTASAGERRPGPRPGVPVMPPAKPKLRRS